MCRKLLSDATLYDLFSHVDRDLAEEVRGSGCSACGGRLHSARYPRKPRGPWLGEDVRRWSFCCAVEGCRKRHLPPSVQFVGRRVFWSVVVVLVSALRHGVSGRRARELREWVGVSRRTLERWRRWWTTTFPRTRCWRELRARLDGPVDPATLPRSLLERVTSLDALDPLRLLRLLKLLMPLTTSHEGAGAM